MSAINLQDLVENSIQELRAAEEAHKSAREANRRAQVARAMESIRQWLGDLVALLEYGTTDEVWRGRETETLDRLTIRLTFPPDAQLAPVSIVWHNYTVDGHRVLAHVDTGEGREKVTEAGLLLAKARQHWNDWKRWQEQEAKAARERKKEDWVDKLRRAGRYWAGISSHDELRRAREAAERVWEQVPDDIRDELTVVWSRLQEHFRKARKRLEARAQRESLKQAYIRTVAQWYRETVLPISESLRQRKEEVESRVIIIYRVEYCLLAEDEDERWVETRDFYTWQDTPGPDGYFVTVDGRRMRPEQVALVEKIQRTVKECPFGVQMYLPRFHWHWGANGISIYFPPEDAAEAEKMRELYPQPTPPPPPIAMSRDEQVEVFRTAMKFALEQEDGG